MILVVLVITMSRRLKDFLVLCLMSTLVVHYLASYPSHRNYVVAVLAEGSHCKNLIDTHYVSSYAKKTAPEVRADRKAVERYDSTCLPNIIRIWRECYANRFPMLSALPVSLNERLVCRCDCVRRRITSKSKQRQPWLIADVGRPGVSDESLETAPCGSGLVGESKGCEGGGRAGFPFGDERSSQRVSIERLE